VDEQSAQPDAQSHAPFVWPPKAAPNESAAGARTIPVDAPCASTPSVRTRLRDALADAERYWLAPTAEPVARRAARVGWSPDALDAYCNRCGETVGPYEAGEFGCSACRDVSWPWDRFVRLGAYDGPLRDWVQEVKFTRWRRLGVDLGRLLGESIREAGAPRERVIVAPTPMALSRRLRRGVDHSRAIAQGAAAPLDASCTPLLKARPHKAQRSLPRSARAKNVAHAFQPLAGPKLAGWTVIVIDDVRTTGATLEAQCRAIRRAWPDVENLWAATLAVTSSPDRRGASDRAAGCANADF
jgi:predicted amidophosphoribosyltransferase